jgi:hypothetical protein
MVDERNGEVHRAQHYLTQLGILVLDMQPCHPRRVHRYMAHISIRGVQPDAGQSRESHSGPGEGVDQEASVITREDEHATTGALEPCKATAGKAEGLGAGEAVESAVGKS